MLEHEDVGIPVHVLQMWAYLHVQHEVCGHTCTCCKDVLIPVMNMTGMWAYLYNMKMWAYLYNIKLWAYLYNMKMWACLYNMKMWAYLYNMKMLDRYLLEHEDVGIPVCQHEDVGIPV